MNLQLTNTVPSINELHEMIKTNLERKYACDVVNDRWTLNFSGPKKCVLIKKSGMVGVCVCVNEKKKVVDIDGIVPNQILEKVVFGNYLTRLLLMPSFKKLEAEVKNALKEELLVKE